MPTPLRSAMANLESRAAAADTATAGPTSGDAKNDDTLPARVVVELPDGDILLGEDSGRLRHEQPEPSSGAQPQPPRVGAQPGSEQWLELRRLLYATGLQSLVLTRKRATSIILGVLSRDLPGKHTGSFTTLPTPRCTPRVPCCFSTCSTMTLARCFRHNSADPPEPCQPDRTQPTHHGTPVQGWTLSTCSWQWPALPCAALTPAGPRSSTTALFLPSTSSGRSWTASRSAWS